MEIQNSAASVQAQMAVGIGKKAMDTEAALVNNLMTKSLANTEQMANQARASQGVGTQLDVIA